MRKSYVKNLTELRQSIVSYILVNTPQAKLYKLTINIIAYFSFSWMSSTLNLALENTIIFYSMD